MIDGHDQPPPTPCSYSASGRSQRSQQRRFRQRDRRRFDRASRPGDAGDAVEVGRVDNPLAAAGGLGMPRHLGAAMLDAHATLSDDHLHALANQPPRHAVAVAVDLDRTVRLHPADQLAPLPTLRQAQEAAARRAV